MSPREERNGSRGRCTSPACQAISASWCTVPKWSLIHQRDKPAGRSGRLKRGGSEKIKKTVLYTLQYACQLILDTLLFSTLLLTFNPGPHWRACVCGCKLESDVWAQSHWFPIWVRKKCWTCDFVTSACKTSEQAAPSFNCNSALTAPECRFLLLTSGRPWTRWGE